MRSMISPSCCMACSLRATLADRRPEDQARKSSLAVASLRSASRSATFAWPAWRDEDEDEDEAAGRMDAASSSRSVSQRTKPRAGERATAVSARERDAEALHLASRWRRRAAWDNWSPTMSASTSARSSLPSAASRASASCGRRAADRDGGSMDARAAASAPAGFPGREPAPLAARPETGPLLAAPPGPLEGRRNSAGAAIASDADRASLLDGASAPKKPSAPPSPVDEAGPSPEDEGTRPSPTAASEVLLLPPAERKLIDPLRLEDAAAAPVACKATSMPQSRTAPRVSSRRNRIASASAAVSSGTLAMAAMPLRASSSKSAGARGSEAKSPASTRAVAACLEPPGPLWLRAAAETRDPAADGTAADAAMKLAEDAARLSGGEAAGRTPEPCAKSKARAEGRLPSDARTTAASSPASSNDGPISDATLRDGGRALRPRGAAARHWSRRSRKHLRA
mmetsp:Transcript_24902/g.94165  ORF Transcript_24902/g.94165 Transcript_24902/m.94165 type:complete len:456 (+) Transcript_24902:695-2062(+)